MSSIYSTQTHCVYYCAYMVSYFVNHGSSIILVSLKGVGTFHKYIGTLNLTCYHPWWKQASLHSEKRITHKRRVGPKEPFASNTLTAAGQGDVANVRFIYIIMHILIHRGVYPGDPAFPRQEKKDEGCIKLRQRPLIGEGCMDHGTKGWN